MKRYIATSSLNIDNITTLESISPSSFYHDRKYGYNSFEKVKDLSDENNVVLYPEIPSFDIQDPDRENYPMVIELDDDKQLGLADEDNSIIKFGSTIFLNPLNCKFLFFSDKAKIMSKLKCDDSKCNKLGEYFRIETISKDKAKKFEKTDIVIERSNDSDDKRVNTQKGFVYGYSLGLLRSISPNSAKLLSLQREIYNYVVSIIANKGENTQSYKDKVLALEQKFKESDSNIQKLTELWNSKFDENATNELKELGFEVPVKTKFANKHNIPLRNIRYSENPNYNFEWDLYNFDLESYISKILFKDRIKLSDIDILSTCNKSEVLSITENDDSDKLYNHLLSKFFFSGNCSVDKLRLNRAELAKDILSDIFEFTKDKQKYFSSLMFNIAKSEAFDILSTDNILFQSIAAFLLKGEDFESLITFMQEKGIYEYKYVLGFWGAMTGYADISKSIARPILQDQTFEKFYKQSYKLVFDIDLEGKLTKYTSPSKIYIQPEPASNETQVFVTISYPIIDKLQFILLTDIFKNLDYKIQFKIREGLSKIKDDGDLYENVLAIQKPFGRQGLTKTNWEKCISQLTPKKKKGLNSNDPTLFPGISEPTKENIEMEESKFEYDNIKNILNFISTFVTIEGKTREYLKKDLVWVLDPKFCKNKSVSQVIDDFKQNLLEGKNNPISKNGKNMDWKNQAYANLDIDLIITKLIEKYVNPQQ